MLVLRVHQQAKTNRSEPPASEHQAQFNQDMQAIRALSIVGDK
jgi:hypothetical protein